MTFKVRRCRKCGALGVGPHPVKLYPFEDHLLCAEDFRGALQWHEQRGYVVDGIRSMDELRTAVLRPSRTRSPAWEPYIRDLCGLAEFGLLRDDKKIFVRYFALAVLAWGMREVQ